MMELCLTGQANSFLDYRRGMIDVVADRSYYATGYSENP